MRLISRAGSATVVDGLGGAGLARAIALTATLVVLAWPSLALGASSVYVVNLGGSVSQYDVAATGALAPKTPATIAAGFAPAVVALTPDAASAYITNQFGTSVSQFTIGPGGALEPKTPATIAAGSEPAEVAVSPDGTSVYITNQGSDSVSQYTVGPGGVLAPKTPPTIAAGDGARGVAVSPDGADVYVTNSHSNSVSQYSVGAGGALAPKSSATITAGGFPAGVAVSPDGASVYVTNISGGSVSQYSVGAGGALAPKSSATITAGVNPGRVAVSPDGTSVYVTNYSSDSVSQYSVGPSGALAPKTPATIAAGSQPAGVAVSPDGTSVYITNQNSDSVSQYSIGPGGALTPKAPATITAGNAPHGVAVLPDQGPLAAFTPTVAPAGSATHFDASASSDRDGSIGRYDWDFGDGSIAVNAGPTPAHSYAAGTYTVRLTVTDTSGCSTRFVFTGQTASCAGRPAATTTRTITIPAPRRPPPSAGCGKSTSKLSLARATFDRSARTISILAPITRHASGTVQVTLRAAGRTTRINAPIDRRNGRVRVTRPISAAQAKLGSGIITINYAGDNDTRAQSVRLRAANTPAALRVTRPRITSRGFLRASGRVSAKARGVVHVQLEYVTRSDGRTVILKRSAPITRGRWRISSRLSPSLRDQITRRCGTVHSYTSFTGYLPQRLRGELHALQVLTNR